MARKVKKTEKAKKKSKLATAKKKTPPKSSQKLKGASNSNQQAKAKASSNPGAFESLKSLVKIAEKHHLSEVEWRSAKGESISFKRALGAQPVQTTTVSKLDTAEEGSVQKNVKLAPKSNYGKVITSPFVGTFYRSSSPDSEPFVSEGSKINQGDVLCIIEAMKLMNEIESEESGVIKKILIEDGQPVEFGESLFELE